MKYFILSGLALRDNNRGTAALGYGAFSFLEEKGFIKEGYKLLSVKGTRNIFKTGIKTENIHVQGKQYISHILTVPSFQISLARKFGILIPFTRLRRYLKNTSFVAAINGGDGFSDIYNTQTFFSRLNETLIAIKNDIPVILLPQTIGPFELESNRKIANEILHYAKYIYVRDDKFVLELQKMGLKYEITKDLSYYMKPQPWDIDIIPNSIGINVSGLAYSNQFRSLSGQFDGYPKLIDSLITRFQQLGKTVYLIPHSYNYLNPEYANDDMEACKAAYDNLKDKTNVILINEDLISPQVKYVISKMSFFIGTRMHANFAAIYTGVPLFGLAYSYKFEGAFKANNIHDSTCMINNIKIGDITNIVNLIVKKYHERIK